MRPTPAGLRQMYIDEQMSTRAVAAVCGVSHMSVKRWLKADGIPARPTGRGLANRGIAAPTSEELHNLVHVEHLSYQEIGARYGVDFTAVPHWLTRHGIPKPTIWGTRFRGSAPTLPTEAELRARRGAGESLKSISKTTGVGVHRLSALCDRYQIPVDRSGWRGGVRFDCKDGHLARSTYELRVDDWLTEHGIAHEVEPAYPWDRRFRADFLVGDTYIEVWGVTNNARYTARRAHKIAMCEATGVDLIQINYWQFSKKGHWSRRLERLLVEDLGAHLF